MANPPVRSRSTTIFDLIRKVDPDYQRARRQEIEYDYRERPFYANPAVRGPYAPDTDHGIAAGTSGYALRDDDGNKIVWSGDTSPSPPELDQPSTDGTLTTVQGVQILVGDGSDDTLETNL